MIIRRDIFCYPYGEDGLLIAKVAEITIDGSTITITITGASDLEMTDVFQAVKIQGDEENAAFGVDPSTCDEGITHLGEEPPDQAAPQASVEGGGTATVRLARFRVSFKEETNNSETTASGSLTLAVGIGISYLVSKEETYIEFQLEPSLEVSLSVEKEIEVSKRLGERSTVIAGCVKVGIEPKAVFEFTGEITFSYTIHAVVGFKYDSSAVPQLLQCQPRERCQGPLRLPLSINWYV